MTLDPSLAGGLLWSVAKATGQSQDSREAEG